ncbi:MAG: hypothetical protein U5K29_04355 [Acidimicrobiales bacterium]|nr:hypothetical protein [Acidimicrobiales bacterium]
MFSSSTRTRSEEIWSSSAAIWARIVRIPWPTEEQPDRTVTEPSG